MSWASDDEKVQHFHTLAPFVTGSDAEDAYFMEREAELDDGLMMYERLLEDMGRALDPEGYEREDQEYWEGVALGVFTGQQG